MERNLCKEAGCSAACCMGATFQCYYPVEKILEWFPDAIKVGDSDLPDIWVRGVYYEVNKYGRGLVRIIGNCPNLDPVNNCLIYKNRPPDCANLGIISESCLIFRDREDSLNRIDDVLTVSDR